MTSTEKLIERLTEDYYEAKEEGYVDMDAVSWGYQEGVLLSYNEVKQLLDFIEFLEGQMQLLDY